MVIRTLVIGVYLEFVIWDLEFFGFECYALCPMR